MDDRVIQDKDQFGSNRIRHLAAERLSAWVAAEDTSSSQGLSVAECIPILKIHASEMRVVDPDRLEESLSWDGRWHLQITRDGFAVGSARVLETSEGIKVCSWSVGLLAKTVDAGLIDADRRMLSESHFLIMIEARPLAFSALLFVPRESGATWVLPIQVPSSLRNLLGNLVDAHELLARARNIPAIQGLIGE